MRIRLAVALLSLAVFASPARAQMDSREAIALQNQILALQRDVQILADQVQRGAPPAYAPAPRGGGGGGGSDLVAQLLERVSRLEDEVRRLRGRLDEVSNQQDRQNAELSKQVGDINFRLQSPSAPAAQPGPPPGNPGPSQQRSQAAPAAAASTRRPPELAMQEGNAALARRDYPAAEAAAREILASGRGPRLDSAQFLLAQALAGKRDYQAAAVAYDDAYNRQRTGPRAQDSLLGLANALLAIGEKPSACATLDKLRGEFTSPRPDIREQIAAARTRGGCR